MFGGVCLAEVGLGGALSCVLKKLAGATIGVAHFSSTKNRNCGVPKPAQNGRHVVRSCHNVALFIFIWRPRECSISSRRTVLNHIFVLKNKNMFRVGVTELFKWEESSHKKCATLPRSCLVAARVR